MYTIRPRRREPVTILSLLLAIHVLTLPRHLHLGLPSLLSLLGLPSLLSLPNSLLQL
jgi:hypothetical protein